jgi:hypothetical protein
LSIESGIVPDQMKIARVVPVYKSGLNNLFSNYLPISVFLILLKLLERIVCNQIMDFINKNEVLFNNQHGFISNMLLYQKCF